MSETVVVTLRPISDMCDYPVLTWRYPFDLLNRDFNRAAKEAIRFSKKSFKSIYDIKRFEVVSITLI